MTDVSVSGVCKLQCQHDLQTGHTDNLGPVSRLQTLQRVSHLRAMLRPPEPQGLSPGVQASNHGVTDKLDHEWKHHALCGLCG